MVAVTDGTRLPKGGLAIAGLTAGAATGGTLLTSAGGAFAFSGAGAGAGVGAGDGRRARAGAGAAAGSGCSLATTPSCAGRCVKNHTVATTADNATAAKPANHA